MVSWLGWPFRVVPAHVDESLLSDEDPLGHVRRLAGLKAQAPVAGAQSGEVILAADTIVVLDGEVLGKPDNAQHAHAMLASLNGRTHQVITAICLRQLGTTHEMMDTCVSHVRMRQYSIEDIGEYVKSGDPLDKAGAYAIQHQGFHPTQGFSGCQASVMGLPLCHLERTLRGLPEYEPTRMDALCQNRLEYECPIAARVLAGENIG